MNQPYARVNQPYATLTLASALREMFGVQLYKNNARALLSRILNILNLDWLQHALSVRGVYEYSFTLIQNSKSLANTGTLNAGISELIPNISQKNLTLHFPFCLSLINIFLVLGSFWISTLAILLFVV